MKTYTTLSITYIQGQCCIIKYILDVIPDNHPGKLGLSDRYLYNSQTSVLFVYTNVHMILCQTCLVTLIIPLPKLISYLYKKMGIMKTSKHE